jgi:hypothetical protein
MNNDPPLLHVLGGFLIFVSLIALIVALIWRSFTRRPKPILEPKPHEELPTRKPPVTPRPSPAIESEVSTGTPWSAETAEGLSSPAFGLQVRIEWSEESGARRQKFYLFSPPSRDWNELNLQIVGAASSAQTDGF